MWGVDQPGYIYAWDESNFQWHIIPGQLNQVDITLVNGNPQVFGVDKAYGAWR